MFLPLLGSQQMGPMHGIQTIYTVAKWVADMYMATHDLGRTIESAGYMTANTNITVHEGQLFALHDLDLPYEVCAGHCFSCMLRSGCMVHQCHWQ